MPGTLTRFVAVSVSDEKLREEILAHPELYHHFYIKNNKIYLKQYTKNEDKLLATVPKDVYLRENAIKKVFIKFNDNTVNVSVLSND